MIRRRLLQGLVAAVLALAAWPVARFATWRRPAVRDVRFSPQELAATGVLYKDEVFLLPGSSQPSDSAESAELRKPDESGESRESRESGHNTPRLALSARCSHLGCLVSFDAVRREFHCPCHQSVYDAQGRRLSGPTESSLERLPVSLQEDGGLVVKAPV